MPTRPRWSPAKATILAVVGVGVLVVAVWVATLLVPNPQPATVEAASTTVTGYLERIEDTIPAGSVLERSEEITRGPCPLDERGDQARVRRVLDIDPAFDRVSWAAALADEFPEADGWVVRIRPLDSSTNLGVRIVGRDLIVIDVTASDDSGQARITMRATSECSRPN